MNPSLNQLCVIEGDYKIDTENNIEVSKNNKSPSKTLVSNNEKLNTLIESYNLKIKNNQIGTEKHPSNDFVILHSKDGSELCSSLLQSLGAYDFDTTLINSTVTNDKSLNINQRYTSSGGSNFVCFLVSDFDQNDCVFLKLEETQSKLSSIFNSLNNSASTTITNNTITNNNSHNNTTTSSPNFNKRFLIFGWPVLNHCLENNMNLNMVTEVERPLYCKIMSGCFVCFTGFRKENKHTVAYCIKLVHYMGGSVRKEYNKKITHLIVKSTLSTKYKTAYNIGRCQLLTEDWIIDAWKHRNDTSFNVNNEEFLKKFKLKALYSLHIAFYGFTKEETQHMKEVTIENGGTPINDLNDPLCTHIVINDQEIKQIPILTNGIVDDIPYVSTTTNGAITTGNVTPTSKLNAQTFININMSPFSNTRASIVRAEWFWASIQICCRASECLYEFTKPKPETAKQNFQDPPTKRIKLSSDNLLSSETLNSTVINNATNTTNNNANKSLDHLNTYSPHHTTSQRTSNQFYSTSQTPILGALDLSGTNNVVETKLKSTNNLLSNQVNTSNNLGYESPTLVTNNRLSTGDRRLNNISNNLSTSASLLDATTDDAMSVSDSPFEKTRESQGHGILNSASSNGANNAKKTNKRTHRIIELYETEKRFVNILHSIIYLFKEPIEAQDQVAGPILDQTEIKEIFGNLPPIYEVHLKIRDRLEKLVNHIHSEESVSVGQIYLDNSEALLKTYPPFVNFYEKTKDAITKCDTNKPRFHAFLKIAQSKPECCRQHLTELLIRPVQRLPSTLLLLDDILKETPKTHRDNELLTKAIGSLKEVMTHINEDKRKIENQLAMFVLINDIENCPATLLSSHRNFLKKLDVYEMSNELLKKGAQLTLFLFSDCLEICKPRLKLLNATKSPNAKCRTPQKCYKHIALFSLNNITKVCDILQNNDDTDLFGILCRLAGEKDKFFSFKVIATNSAYLLNNQSSNQSNNGNTTMNSNSMTLNSTASFNQSTSTLSSVPSSLSAGYSSIYASTSNLNYNEEHYQAQLEKKEYIKLLAQGICNVKCITEYENILCTIEAKQLQIDLNESGGSKKLDAVKSYARIINRRVSRAFSFSQDTPNKIKKTISSVFRSPFQSSYSQQSLNEQKASKLTSLASLQLTPTLMETKRKFITLQKSSLPLGSPPEVGHKSNQPRRGSHTIHLLSTRTLRNLRSTTTSTINGIAAAYNSMSSNNSQSTSNFSISSSLASIHRSNKKSYKVSESVSNFQKANSDVGNYSDDEDMGRDDIEYEDENDDEDQPSKVLDDNNYLDINNENHLAVNLFPSAKKKMLTSQSIKNLKKKKFNQFLMSKSSMKRYNEDNDDLFLNNGTNLKKCQDVDSMEFEQLNYESNEKLTNCGNKQESTAKLYEKTNVLVQSTNLMKNKQKLDTL